MPAGVNLPYQISDKFIYNFDNGNETKGREIVWLIDGAANVRAAFLAAVARTLDGMQLAGLSESVDGTFATVTATYEPYNGGKIAWWTSTREGRIYHEREKIANTTAATSEYADYASTPQKGLTPNGCNISPDYSAEQIDAEASWGPQQATTAEELEGEPLTAINFTSADGEAEVTRAAAIYQMTTSASGGGQVSQLEEIMAQFAGDLISGRIKKAGGLQNAGRWVYNDNNASLQTPIAALDDVADLDLVAIAEVYLDPPKVACPILKCSITKTVKSDTEKIDLSTITAEVSKAGQLYDEIPELQLAAPDFRPAFPAWSAADAITMRTQWMMEGISATAQTTPVTVAGTTTADPEKVYVGEYAINYRTVTTIDAT